MNRLPDNEPKAWYRSFFDDAYLQVYGHLLTPDRSATETDFLLRTLALNAGDRLLDLCCGHGRHAVGLAVAGLDVTALDLNPASLATAAQHAGEVGASLRVIESDMRTIPFSCHFDAIINMFTAFGYFESEAENERVLEAVRTALRPGGRFLVDLLNREWLVRNYIPKEWWERDGSLYLEERTFDPQSSRNRVRFVVIGPDGARQEIPGHDIRVYALHEMIAMLSRAGLRFTAVYGGFDGEPYGLKTRRMIVVARRPD
ncbi:MAG: class I SAM-dependent methyltransferase [Dehalococcoidia bacterium]|nr:class I SAM-dependent methyltransferase [Dehalococcoidia bacterium]